MKYYFYLFLMVSLFNLSFAQDSSKVCSDELRHGLEFQIGSMLTLTNFENYTFSYRYRFNNNSGLRIGFYTDINKDDYDLTQQVDSITINPPYYDHYYNIKISVQYLQSFISINRFSFLLGGGPFISYSKRDSKYENLSSSYRRKYENNNKTTGYGLDIISGVEYKLAENITLSGEYGLSVYKENSDIESAENDIFPDPSQNRIYKQSGTIDSFTIRGLGVNLGISVFF